MRPPSWPDDHRISSKLACGAHLCVDLVQRLQDEVDEGSLHIPLLLFGEFPGLWVEINVTPEALHELVRVHDDPKNISI